MPRSTRLTKTKEDRDNLMEHYKMMFKKKQAELDSIKALDKEKGSRGEIMVQTKATTVIIKFKLNYMF